MARGRCKLLNAFLLAANTPHHYLKLKPMTTAPPKSSWASILKVCMHSLLIHMSLPAGQGVHGGLPTVLSPPALNCPWGQGKQVDPPMPGLQTAADFRKGGQYEEDTESQVGHGRGLSYMTSLCSLYRKPPTPTATAFGAVPDCLAAALLRSLNATKRRLRLKPAPRPDMDVGASVVAAYRCSCWMT